MTFINAQAKLTDLNIKANSVYTQIIDNNVKPMVMDLYKKILSEQRYGKAICFGDMDYYLTVLSFDNHDVLLIKDSSTCFDRNTLSFVIANKDHVKDAYCFDTCRYGEAKENGFILNNVHSYNDGIVFFKKEETLCEPYYNSHSLYQMKNSNGFNDDNVIFCINTVEHCYRNVIIENNFKVS